MPLTQFYRLILYCSVVKNNKTEGTQNFEVPATKGTRRLLLIYLGKIYLLSIYEEMNIITLRPRPFLAFEVY
jgi:hypothetical protein